MPDDYPIAAAAESLPVDIIGQRVFCPRDMYRWERSEAMADIVAFVEQMNVVAGRQRPVEVFRTGATGNINKAMEVLLNVCEWAEKYEPDRNDFTVGPSFVKFHEVLRNDGFDFLIRTYGSPGDHRIYELSVYLEKSFGDPETMTYGLEHELSFCMFLIALFKLHYLTCADESYVVAILFSRYGTLECTEKI